MPGAAPHNYLSWEDSTCASVLKDTRDAYRYTTKRFEAPRLPASCIAALSTYWDHCARCWKRSLADADAELQRCGRLARICPLRVNSAAAAIHRASLPRRRKGRPVTAATTTRPK